jgi:hypothetical protein
MPDTSPQPGRRVVLRRLGATDARFVGLLAPQPCGSALV